MNRNISKIYEGHLKAGGLKFGIVCSRFNDFLVAQLLDGAIDCIVRHGGTGENITVVWVPGAYEIPLAVDRLAQSGRFNALIALGVVIQGATPHARYINNHVSNSLGQISLKTQVPINYGIVTTKNIEQAIERSGTKEGNHGTAAAAAAIEMANLMKALTTLGPASDSS